MLGETIGKYKIIGHIDRGGMADVYKALHPELNRVVALKVLNRALVRSPEMLERFRREARAIAALRHPNIVQVFDLDVVDGLYFMVMEYVEGETLSQRVTHLCECGERMLLSEVLHIIIAVGCPSSSRMPSFSSPASAMVSASDLKNDSIRAVRKVALSSLLSENIFRKVSMASRTAALSLTVR